MNYVNFQSRLRRNFSGSVNFKPVFSSDSVNVARPLSKTTTKSMSQPILSRHLMTNESGSLPIMQRLRDKKPSTAEEKAQGNFEQNTHGTGSYISGLDSKYALKVLKHKKKICVFYSFSLFFPISA